MEYQGVLLQMFPNKSREVIENIITIVEENSPLDNIDYKMETMVNLLTETGNSTQQNREPYLLDEAAGFDPAVSTLPESCAKDRIFSQLLDMFPNVDPTFVKQKYVEISKDPEALENFILETTDQNNYPTYEEYKRNLDEMEAKEQYTKNFLLTDFLKKFPKAIEHFTSSERVHSLSCLDEDNENDKTDRNYAIIALCNHYRYLRRHDIEKVFKKCNRDIVLCGKKLDSLPNAFKRPRDIIDCDYLPKNMLLLQELAFVMHKKEILDQLTLRDKTFEMAKDMGLLETCTCCYFSELIPEECFFCSQGCIFCKDCITRGAEVAIGEQKLEFKCFNECDGEIRYSTLQMVLDSQMFSNLCQNKQLDDLNKAQIDGLELCPLCFGYAIIPNPEDKIFHCEKCFKDSCRECKHVSHVPLQCSEVEYDRDVKMRTHIEDEMSKALLRNCWNCGKAFIKNSGCNKITCTCGSMMCYLCGTEVKDYNHFGDRKCPLFTDDNTLNYENVVKGALKAKQELGIDVDPSKLKFDPMKNFDEQFRNHN